MNLTNIDVVDEQIYEYVHNLNLTACLREMKRKYYNCVICLRSKKICEYNNTCLTCSSFICQKCAIENLFLPGFIITTKFCSLAEEANESDEYQTSGQFNL